VERGIAIGEVRVEFASGIIAVMGVDAAGIAAEAATRKNWPSEDDANPPPKITASGSRCW